MKGAPDDELVERARFDPDGFDELYLRHAPTVHGWLRGQLHSEQDALDLTAEVFAQAWSARGRFRPHESGSAGPWLHGIARNLLAQSRRHGRLTSRAVQRLGVRTQVAHSPSEDDDLERITVAQLGPSLTESMQALPAAQREAIAMRVLDDLPYEQVARHMNATVENTRMRVARGLRTLGTSIAGRYA